MNKALKIIGAVLFVLWGASTAWELMEREPGGQISIVGQLFFNVGVPYFILFLILLWFLKRSGLDKLPAFMAAMENEAKEIKEAAKSTGPSSKSGGSDA